MQPSLTHGYILNGLTMELIHLQMEKDVEDMKEQLAQSLFDHIPVGVGSQAIIPTSAKDLEAALEMGMDWSLREVGNSRLVVVIVRRSGCCSGNGLWRRAHMLPPQI